MPLRMVVIVGLLLTLGWWPLAPASDAQGGARGTRLPAGHAPPVLLAGPNIRVNPEDLDAAHIETMIAAHPVWPGYLVGTSIVATRTGKNVTRAYTSEDGGYSWAEHRFEPVEATFGGDPAVAFGAGSSWSGNASAYFVTLGSGVGYHELGVDAGAFEYLYRSSDGGRTWQLAANLVRNADGDDHPQIGVDQGIGPYAGRVYITAASGVWRSDDDGRTFRGPVVPIHPWSTPRNSNGIAVLSDGRLVTVWTCPTAEQRPATDAATVALPYAYCAMVSTDGGVSFQRPVRAFDRFIPPVRTVVNDQASGRVAGSEDVQLVADSRGTRFRDRIYVVWVDRRFGRPRILVAASRDRGDHWSMPARVDASVPGDADQFMPTAAVSSNGTLAIGWLDTRLTLGAVGSQQGSDYFMTVSTDGGASFAAPIRVSSETSFPARAGNFAAGLHYEQAIPHDTVAHVVVVSAFDGAANGGDYMGLTSDAAGVFHPFWADSRTGTYQLFTARVEVLTADLRDSLWAKSMQASTARKGHSARVENDKVRNRVEAIEYDSASHATTLRMRLQNVSTDTLFGSLTLELMPEDTAAIRPENEPFDMQNAEGAWLPWPARYDVRANLGSYPYLPPGAITEPVTIRLRSHRQFGSSFQFTTSVLLGPP